jgi:uncharacterized protein YdhG (YjbR/CyaY superfamily)
MTREAGDRKPATPATVDEYIAGFPPEVREILEAVRTVVRQAAPEAREAIKYQMPTYVLNGNLLSFGAYKHHIGLYPRTAAMDPFADELAPYLGAKSSLRFPLDQPMPLELIGKVVRARVEESAAKAGAKRKQG